MTDALIALGLAVVAMTCRALLVQPGRPGAHPGAHGGGRHVGGRATGR